MYLSSTEGDRSSLPSFLIFLFESFLPKSGILPNSRAYTRTIRAMCNPQRRFFVSITKQRLLSSIFPLDDRGTPMHQNALRTSTSASTSRRVRGRSSTPTERARVQSAGRVLIGRRRCPRAGTAASGRGHVRRTAGPSFLRANGTVVNPRPFSANRANCHAR